MNQDIQRGWDMSLPTAISSALHELESLIVGPSLAKAALLETEAPRQRIRELIALKDEDIKIWSRRPLTPPIQGELRQARKQRQLLINLLILAEDLHHQHNPPSCNSSEGLVSGVI